MENPIWELKHMENEIEIKTEPKRKWNRNEGGIKFKKNEIKMEKNPKIKSKLKNENRRKKTEILKREWILKNGMKI